MGRGLSVNLVDKGIGVVAWDRSEKALVETAWAEGSDIEICRSLQDMVEKLAPPRCILLSIPSGAPVDEVLSLLAAELSSGDVVAECGNSYFRDTKRRVAMMRAHNVAFLGIGVSGGPEGARKGPAIMAGGDHEAWEKMHGVFNSIAAKVDNAPCCEFFGDGGAGQFVKMIHNGIEYAIMHLIMETYAILERVCGFSPERIAREFERLETGPTACFLMRVSAKVSGARDPEHGQFLIDLVDDVAGQKGTGQWTVQTALELGISAPTLAEAVMSRSLSSNSILRSNRIISGPSPVASSPSKERLDIVDILPEALALAFASAFVQGLSICDAAEPVLGQGLEREAILRSWRRGCILEGAMVERLLAAEIEDGANKNILASGGIEPLVRDGREALRKVVSDAVQDGIPCSGLASALAYVEALQGSSLPTALIQLQRDFFGRHGLKDKEKGLPIQAPWFDDPNASPKGKGSQ